MDGIKSCIGKVKDAVSNVASTITSFLHFSVPDEGPLTDYESWMPDFMAGLAKGIEDSKSMVAKAMDGVASDMVISPSLTSAAADGGSYGTSDTSCITGYKAKLEKDTSYKGLWSVSFTLNEF